MEVIAVGTAAIDVICEVGMYPKEDSKARSLATYKCRGGNAASALVVCSQLGGRCRCRWLSTSTDPDKDSDARFIFADLAAYNVDSSLAVIEEESSMSVSYIISGQATGPRTIVHSRTIAELSSKTLASLANYVFVSEDYLRDNVFASSAEQILAKFKGSNGTRTDPVGESIVCRRDSEGYYLKWDAGSTERHPYSTVQHRSLTRGNLESNGAGDSFIGAALAGLSRGNAPFYLVLKTACDVATFKCSQHGFHLPCNKVLEWKSALQS
ncbi:unnamed protein product [Peronospora destructor]|uniref:Carbohydrate kinase PfkB domain-containing protein n=1 Tax=Peronospora destructor TaxID=86335 RepID=A0AAV0V3M9_9STRA|nr:unnamed protein product [Peronospora destructor]